MGNTILGLFGALGLTAIGFFYMKAKKDSAEALLNNQRTKQDVAKIDGQIAKNDAILESEEEKRKAINQQIKDAQNEAGDVIDFFNKRK